jgi:uncharacterized repeat protein (TIGR03803 family)
MRQMSLVFRLQSALAVAFFFFLHAVGLAQTDQILHSFSGSDGSHPNGTVVFDSAGNLYGTTQQGGSNACGGRGCGTAFELSPQSGGNWSYQVIHSFGGVNGESPLWGLVLDSAGNLYGTTAYGGANNFGTVFELQPANAGWTEKVLYSFTGTADGGNPTTGVTIDSAGNLYGTTTLGGANKQGTVFELTKSGGSWSLRVFLDLYDIDGTGPSPLVVDRAGNIYGTATGGGFHMNHKRGTIFELIPGHGTNVLFAFTGPETGGYNPAGGIVFDPAGNIYGTVEDGGYGDAFGGSIYELFSPTWQLQTWEVFTRFPASPHPPLSPVALDSANNIYVALSGDGASVCYGAILKIGKNVYSIYNFGGSSTDGHFPLGGIVLDAQNNVYGATSAGGGAGYGTIFKVTLP